MALQRRRPRLRSKGTAVDPTTTIDMSDAEPIVTLRKGSRGDRLWQDFQADPPHWWNDHDVPMAGMLCAMTNQVATAFGTSSEASEAGKAALIKEWRSLADQLGLSPTARSRLRMTTAQGVVAAEKAEDLRRQRGEEGEPEPGVIDIDELVSD